MCQKCPKTYKIKTKTRYEISTFKLVLKSGQTFAKKFPQVKTPLSLTKKNFLVIGTHLTQPDCKKLESLKMTQPTVRGNGSKVFFYNFVNLSQIFIFLRILTLTLSKIHCPYCIVNHHGGEHICLDFCVWQFHVNSPLLSYSLPVVYPISYSCFVLCTVHMHYEI